MINVKSDRYIIYPALVYALRTFYVAKVHDKK